MAEEFQIRETLQGEFEAGQACVIDRSGIRNECLRFNDEASEAGDTRQSEADAWLEQLCNMSPEQLQVLRDAISAVESASSRVDECEGEQHVKQA